MKRSSFFQIFLFLALGLLISQNTTAQVYDNLALDLDGTGDYISLSTASTPVSGDADFTVELWFNANPTGTITRLVSLTGTLVPSTIEVGLLGAGQLFVYWQNTPLNGGPPFPLLIPTLPADLTGACHHLALTRSGGSIQVYLDCVLVATYTSSNVGPFNFDQLLVGHSNYFPAQDFNGQVDEIRLWSQVRSAQQLCEFKDCTLSGVSPGLVANWNLNEPGVVPGGSNAGAIATDISGNNNHGTLNGFALNGGTSNFVGNTCPPAYELAISDLPSPFPILLTTICSGSAVHMCVTENSNQITAPPGSTVVWETSDGIIPFSPDLALQPYSNLGYTCFGVPPGVMIANNCATSQTGFEDRRIRAKITKSMVVNGGIQLCTYTTSIHDLRICCPIVNATVQTTVQAPLPFNGILCEDPAKPVVIDVALTGPAFLGNLTIQWCLNGQPIAGVGNVTSFTYNGLAVFPQMCFEAKIQNCSCPQVHPSACIQVDKMPMCGLIDVVVQNSVMHDPLGGNYDYLICPGDFTQVAMLNPTDFKNCNATWQYHFDTDAAGVWYDLLGTTNPIQNTNILPQLSPPNVVGSPYLWPPAANCIYYRIECRPLHTPSGCEPCHSNEVRICLKSKPLAGNITGISPICFGANTVLTVMPSGNYTYTWYWNGLQVQSGPSPAYTASDAGIYWVEISDGCQKVVTALFSLEVCEIKAIIKCPTDNPCACDGMPITLDGCASFATCLGTGPLTYAWSDTDGHTGSGCTFTDIPNPAGTTYFLTVCNALNPACCATTKLYIKPCQ